LSRAFFFFSPVHGNFGVFTAAKMACRRILMQIVQIDKDACLPPASPAGFRGGTDTRRLKKSDFRKIISNPLYKLPTL